MSTFSTEETFTTVFKSLIKEKLQAIVYHFCLQLHWTYTYILLQSQGMARASITNINTSHTFIQCFQLLSWQVESERLLTSTYPTACYSNAAINRQWKLGLIPCFQIGKLGQITFLQHCQHIDADHIMNSCLNKSFSPLIIQPAELQ